MTSRRGPRQPVTMFYNQGGIICPGQVAINATGAHEQILRHASGFLAKLDAWKREDISRWENEGGAT